MTAFVVRLCASFEERSGTYRSMISAILAAVDCSIGMEMEIGEISISISISISRREAVRIEGWVLSAKGRRARRPIRFVRVLSLASGKAQGEAVAAIYLAVEAANSPRIKLHSTPLHHYTRSYGEKKRGREEEEKGRSYLRIER